MTTSSNHPFERMVALVGMPRSGTSWVSQIIDSCPHVRFKMSPLFSYPFKNALTEQSTPEDCERVFQGAHVTADPFMDQERERKEGRYPNWELKDEHPPVLAIKMTRFHNLLSMLLNNMPTVKFAALVRHPCGSIHSWLNTPKEFPAGADPKAEWRTGACRKTGYGEFWGFEDWISITKLHLNLEDAHSDRFRIFQYEQIVADPLQGSADLLGFLGLGLTGQTRHFLEESHRRHDSDTHSVFRDRTVKDKWRTQLDPEIRDQIIQETEAAGLGRFLV